MELGWIDYSFKPAKPMVSLDQVAIERLLATTVFPILYGAMPNMGLYYTPDGPFINPADLLGMMKVDEAREEEMKASELCMEDMIFVCKRMAEIGADGIDFDTTASAGDADFLATLKTVEELKKTTNLGIEVGMSGEFILGMHGEVEYKGKRLAGMFPQDQLKVVEEAGADIFGPVVNTKTTKSAPWNVARAVTFVKEVCKQATIPIHANVGMGVGGTPMFETVPVDALSRASVAMVEIAKVDGL
jgi:dimethylamine--corrinoid protein Co-methyltransferase